MILTESELMHQTGNLRGMLSAFADEYPKAVREGRQEAWSLAIISTVRLFQDTQYAASDEAKK